MGDPVAIQTATVNMKRGLTRLFIVSALCWYLCCGYYLWNRWSDYLYEQAQLDSKPQAEKLKPDFTVYKYLANLHRPGEVTVWLALVPVAVYALGTGIFWIVLGFRSPRPPELKT